MKSLQTTITIAAAAQRVWATLLDFARYPEWNPFVRRIEGDARAGARLAVTVQPDGGRAMSFRPRVPVADPARELRWRGRWLVPGLFDGEHHFLLTATPSGGTLLTHGERFSGALVPLLLPPDALRATERGFEAMNRALKARVEHAATPSDTTPASGAAPARFA